MKTVSTEKTLAELVEQAQRNKLSSVVKENEQRPKTTQEVILEAELDLAKRGLKNLNDILHYKNRCYTVTELPGDVIRMETGLPTKEVFDIVVRHALRFKDSINYFGGWKVESITFEDQIFITLMKVRQNTPIYVWLSYLIVVLLQLLTLLQNVFMYCMTLYLKTL